MSRFIAFLRAINVGGHTVKMDQLRQLFESLGFSGIETFIASGNVVFDVHEREVYWLCRRKQSESTFSNAVLEKTLGRPSTLRGVNTVQKMAAKYAVFKPKGKRV